MNRIYRNACLFWLIALGCTGCSKVNDVSASDGDCTVVFQEQSGGIDQDALREPMTLSDVTLELLQTDLGGRESILSMRLPEEVQSNQYIIKLEEYRQVDYLDKAICLLAHYRDGDSVWRYETATEALYERGFALTREGDIFAVFVMMRVDR